MKIDYLYISPRHIFAGHHGKEPGQTPMQAVEHIECEAGKGIQGDRYFDHKPDYKGQITFFSSEVAQDLCNRFDVSKWDPSVFRRNVIVSGADLNTLIGQEFEIQGVRFFGTEEAKPCYWMNRAFHPGAEDALRGRGGLRAKVLTSGTIRRDR